MPVLFSFLLDVVIIINPNNWGHLFSVLMSEAASYCSGQFAHTLYYKTCSSPEVVGVITDEETGSVRSHSCRVGELGLN